MAEMMMKFISTERPAMLIATTVSALAVGIAVARMLSGSASGKPSAYEELCNYLRTSDSLGGCMAVLEWDELVKMPEASADARSQQKAALAEVMHDRQVSRELGRLVAGAKRQLQALDAFQAANVRDAERAFLQEARKPRELARLESQLGSEGYHAWVKAREAADFSIFSPKLTELVQMRKEVAAKCAKPGTLPYDFCIDQHERGMTAARIQEIFAEVKVGLVPLIKAVLDAPPIKPRDCLMNGPFNIQQQEALCRQVAGDLGFDFDAGRFDVSVHPFTGGPHPSDVRITTRFNDSEFLSSLMGTVHETGHAIYEQGRNQKYNGLPVSEALSMGVHESQSLLWERMIGQSMPFWEYAAAKVHQHFPQTKNARPVDFFQFANIVKPSLIRVDADELTYPLHIVVRFELEQALMDGHLTVDELPKAWNAKYKSYLGVEPPSDKEGILQDIHWSDGSFGYFPTYTLGAMFACQFYSAAVKEIPNLESRISKGDFAPLKEWLNEKIHKVGSVYPSADELCVAVTGEKLKPKAFVDYLTKKYTDLYNLPTVA
mmetsp:Transcript_14443/g.27791  ORF Transcript_14443/g.27791 Transcript_14443/m.27791 type:complete len:547 (+) Transcript_14443:58-1698(+)